MKYTCVTYGEILYDVVDGVKKEGGAPFNVAYHLQQLGLPTTMITRVGNDENGENLQRFMQSKNIDTDFVQVDDEHETSTVIASRNAKGDMEYEIKYPVAWDFIHHQNSFDKLIQEADFFIFGSLSARNEISKKTLFNLMELSSIRVCDINLRPPFINKYNIELLLDFADILKLNEEEFSILCEWNFINPQNVESALYDLREVYQIETIALTKGAKGAVLLHQDVMEQTEGFKINVADTIGSGDSFLAGLIYALSTKKNTKEALIFASQMGAFMATQVGGTPYYKMEDVLKIGK